MVLYKYKTPEDCDLLVMINVHGRITLYFCRMYDLSALCSINSHSRFKIMCSLLFANSVSTYMLRVVMPPVENKCPILKSFIYISKVRTDREKLIVNGLCVRSSVLVP